MRFSVKLFVLLSTMALSACSAFDWMVYKIDIPQGNYIDNAKAEQLRINMSKDQVRYVLGTPMLIDTFDKSRWHYLYSYQEGNGELERRDLVLHFVNERLAFIEGDYETSEDFMLPLDDG